MIRKAMSSVALAVFAAVLQPLISSTASANETGATVGTYTTRVETHSKVPNVNSTAYGNDSYMSGTLSLSRELQKNVTGSIAFTSKYGIKEGDTISNVISTSLSVKMKPHWKGTVTQTHMSNEKRKYNYRKSSCTPTAPPTTCPTSDSDFFNFSFKFTPYIGKKAKAMKYTWDGSLAYNTATDFSMSRTVTPKIGLNRKAGKKLDLNLDYSLVYALNKKTGPNRTTITRDINTHKFAFAADYKLKKNMKVQIGSAYANNKYFGNRGDDLMGQVTVTYTFREAPKPAKDDKKKAPAKGGK